MHPPHGARGVPGRRGGVEDWGAGGQDQAAQGHVRRQVRFFFLSHGFFAVGQFAVRKNVSFG